MIMAFAKLLLILLAAESVTAALNLPIPGAIFALAALFVLYTVTGVEDAETGRLFDLIAPHATLLFIPAAVGVVGDLDAVLSSWITFASVIVFGTTTTIVAVGLAAEVMLKRQSDDSTS